MAITGSTDLGDGILVVTVDHDPVTTPTDAPLGSMIITPDGAWFRKDADGANAIVSLIRNSPGNPSSHLDYDAQNKEAFALVPGQVVTAHSSGLGVVLADASGTTKPAEGFIQLDVAASASARIQTDGLFELPDWTAVIGSATLAAKAKYFLSEIPGELVPTPPVGAGKFVQAVGKAVSPSTLRIEIEDPILL